MSSMFNHFHTNDWLKLSLSLEIQTDALALPVLGGKYFLVRSATSIYTVSR